MMEIGLLFLSCLKGSVSLRNSHEYYEPEELISASAPSLLEHLKRGQKGLFCILFYFAPLVISRTMSDESQR